MITRVIIPAAAILVVSLQGLSTPEVPKSNKPQPEMRPSRKIIPQNKGLTDLSDSVTLELKVKQEQYHQLEPIFLDVTLTNRANFDVSFEDILVFQQFEMTVADLRSRSPITNLTRYGQRPHISPSDRGWVTLPANCVSHFEVCPNLYYDMTVPGPYSVALAMELRRLSDGAACMTRSLPIRVEVIVPTKRP